MIRLPGSRRLCGTWLARAAVVAAWLTLVAQLAGGPPGHAAGITVAPETVTIYVVGNPP